MVNIETDSHRRTYQIWKQDQAASCGVASVWMARSIARQMSFAETEWDLAVRTYGIAVGNALAPLGASRYGQSLDPSSFPNSQQTMASTLSNFGFYPRQLVSVLKAEGLKVHTNSSHIGIIPHYIAINKPAISLVLWDGGGGHFVVVGRCTHSQVSFLDPWVGHVNEQRNNGRYIASYNQGSIAVTLYVSA